MLQAFFNSLVASQAPGAPSFEELRDALREAGSSGRDGAAFLLSAACHGRKQRNYIEVCIGGGTLRDCAWLVRCKRRVGTTLQRLLGAAPGGCGLHSVHSRPILRTDITPSPAPPLLRPLPTSCLPPPIAAGDATKSAQHAAAQCVAVLCTAAGQEQVNASVQRLLGTLQVRCAALPCA